VGSNKRRGQEGDRRGRHASGDGDGDGDGDGRSTPPNPPRNEGAWKEKATTARPQTATDTQHNSADSRWIAWDRSSPAGRVRCTLAAPACLWRPRLASRADPHLSTFEMRRLVAAGQRHAGRPSVHRTRPQLVSYGPMRSQRHVSTVGAALSVAVCGRLSSGFPSWPPRFEGGWGDKIFRLRLPPVSVSVLRGRPRPGPVLSPSFASTATRLFVLFSS